MEMDFPSPKRKRPPLAEPTRIHPDFDSYGRGRRNWKKNRDGSNRF
jgi:hypothetical protein